MTAVGRHLGVAPGDVIGLLEQIGRDTAGALSFGAPGSTSTDDWRPIRNEAALERIIEELPNKPFLAGDEGVSMSLAGVQSKIAVAADDAGTLYIPLDGSPSTHILKPDAAKLWGSVENEAYCLTLARRCGLSVPAFTTGRAGERRYLLVERYDRRRSDGHWRRSTRRISVKRSESRRRPNMKGTRPECGPTLADMIAVARDRLGTRDVLSLLDLGIFNILACNTDGHAKNYSLLIRGCGASLAPAYDVMCAEPYENITGNLAQTIAGKNRGEHLKRRHWERFFREAKLGARASLQRVARLAEAVIAQAAKACEETEALPGVEPGMAAQCELTVVARAHAVIAGLADVTGPEIWTAPIWQRTLNQCVRRSHNVIQWRDAIFDRLAPRRRCR